MISDDMQRRKKADVVIIGGGIIGCAIAYELAKFKLVTYLIEKEPELCFGATGANTGLIHAGFNPKPRSMKARFNLEGNNLYSKLATELNVPYKRIGALVLAKTEAEQKMLDALIKRGTDNGVKGLKILTKKQLHEFEPMLNQNIIAGLLAPSAGIISPYEFSIALAENAAMNGVKFNLSTEVSGIEIKNNCVEAVLTNKHELTTSVVINAAGVFSDTIAGMVGLKTFKISPRRGEYLILDSRAGVSVNHTLFPVPSKVSKGIVVTPTIDGNILLGPTAENIKDKSATETTQSGQLEVLAGAQKLIPAINHKDVISTFAGIRAVPDSNDFIIGPTSVSGFINAAGIASPGLAAAPAIAKYVCTIIQEILPGSKLKSKTNYHSGRVAQFNFRVTTIDEQDSYIKKNPTFGHMVCRCEHVSEGEVISTIRHQPSPITLKGIRHRTRAGMGRCQGAFCSPRIIEILSREHDIPVEKVTLAGPGSELLVKTKKGIKK
jgi:glycerol-3-phosphate dehydrogenase